MCVCVCVCVSSTTTQLEIESRPDDGDKLAHCQLLGDQELGLVQQWQVLLLVVPLHYHLCNIIHNVCHHHQESSAVHDRGQTKAVYIYNGIKCRVLPLKEQCFLKQYCAALTSNVYHTGNNAELATQPY